MEMPTFSRILSLISKPKKRRRISNEDRQMIIQRTEEGENLSALAKELDIHVNTCRSIVATGREYALPRGGRRTKFSEEYITRLRSLLAEHPDYSLRKLKEEIELIYPNISIGINSVDRLLDWQVINRKKMTPKLLAKKNMVIKEKRAAFAEWLEACPSSVLRVYIEETNYKIRCTRNRGCSEKSEPYDGAEQPSKGQFFHVIFGLSQLGITRFECHLQLTWEIFNKFLEQCSIKIKSEQSDKNVVFILDKTPLHERADSVLLCDGHSIKYLPPSSPFFNPAVEALNCLPTDAKELVTIQRSMPNELPSESSTESDYCNILEDLARGLFREITPEKCQEFDRNQQSFVSKAKQNLDL